MTTRCIFASKVHMIVMLLVLVCTMGCSKQNNSVGMDTDNYYLHKEIMNLDLPVEYDYRYFSILGNSTYYVSFYEDSAKRDLCRIGNETQTKEILASWDEGIFLSYVICGSEEASDIYLLTMDYDQYDSFIVSKLLPGGLISNVYEQKFDVASDGYPRFLLVDKEHFYVVFSNSLVICKKDGSSYKTIRDENVTFETGVVCDDGELILVLSSRQRKRYLAKFNSAKSSLYDKTEIDEAVSQFYKSESSLYALCPRGVYEVDETSFLLTKRVDFDYHGISSAEVQSFSYVGDVFFLVTKNYLGLNGTKLIKISNDQEDATTKPIIKIFCPGKGSGDLTEIELLKSYNEMSGEYIAKIIENDGPFDVTFLQEEKPDIIYFYDQDTALNYISNGFCENLSDYMSNSKELSLSEINDKAISVFGDAQKLYAIPTAISAETLLIPARTQQSNTGWNVDEYLDWLCDNSDVRALGGMTKQKILEDCLNGIIDDFIDYEKDSVSFDAGEFARILDRIRDLPHMQNEESIYVSIALANKYDYKHLKYLKRELVMSVYEIAQKEYCLGDVFVFAGYPNASREQLACIECNSIFAIFSEAENKSGAFDFIEYAMKYQYNRTVVDTEGTSIGKMWTIKSLAENDMKRAVGTALRVDGAGSEEEYCINSTEQDVGLFCTVIDSARPLRVSEKGIINIILEEAEPFWEGQKSASEVCSIIQSRASVVVKEGLGR